MWRWWEDLVILSVFILSFITLVSQRKSNKAKEKKARRLEERAAMDAICAKVDAANKVTSSSSQARRHLFIFGCWINPVLERQRPVSDCRAIEGAAWCETIHHLASKVLFQAFHGAQIASHRLRSFLVSSIGLLELAGANDANCVCL